jgi:hypothetical protein
MTDHDYDAPANSDLWTESFVQAGAEVLAKITLDWQQQKQIIQMQNRELTVDFDALLAPLRERIARLEGQVEMLASLLGGDSANGSTRSKRLKQQDNGHSRLLEPPQPQ